MNEKKHSVDIRRAMGGFINRELCNSTTQSTIRFLTDHLVDMAQSYRDDGVAEVGMACMRAQMEEPKVVIIDSLDALYQYMLKDVELTARAHSVMEHGIRIHQQMDEIHASCESLKEATRLAKPITHRQLEWIATIEYVLGIKFAGECYDDAYTWIAGHKDEAAFEQNQEITKEQRKAIKEITKCLNISFTGRHCLQASKFIHRYAELVEHIQEGYQDAGSYYAGR